MLLQSALIFFMLLTCRELGSRIPLVTPIKVPDSTHRPDDLAYFTFRSVVSAHLVDKRAPEKPLPLEFSLRLPQNFQPAVVIPTPSGTPITQSPVPNTPTSTTNTPADDTTRDGLGVTELRVLLLAARAAHSSPLVTPFTAIVAPSNLFLTFTPTNISAVPSSSTVKMDRIRSVVTSRGSMTYTGPMNFLDSQDSFNLIFGSHPTILRLTSGKKTAIYKRGYSISRN